MSLEPRYATYFWPSAKLLIQFPKKRLLKHTTCNRIRPIAVYGCETLVLKESIIQRLSVFQRKISRKIFGPTKEDNGIWRIKTNRELGKLIKPWNIINYVNP